MGGGEGFGVGEGAALDGLPEDSEIDGEVHVPVMDFYVLNEGINGPTDDVDLFDAKPFRHVLDGGVLIVVQADGNG